MKRRHALAALGAAPLSALAGRAGAQAPFPNRPVKIVVPFGPGGSTDITSRIIGKFLETATGQPFVIENKPGATGMIGTGQVKQTPPDGYTWLFGSTSTLAANPSLYKQMSYDPEDFSPITIVGSAGNFVLVNKDAPYKTIAEFIAYAKDRKPGEVFSGYGNASSRVPSAMFEIFSGVKLEEVSYRDAVASLQDLMAGRVHVVMPDQVVGESFVRGAQVRAIAITSPKRTSKYPDLPTVGETLPGYELISYGGFAVRKETPAELKTQILALVTSALKDPTVRGRLEDLGWAIPEPIMDLEQSIAFVRNQREIWTKYIKLAKIEPQ